MQKVGMIVTVGKKRVSVPQNYYNTFTEFILEQLERNAVVPLLDLLDAAQSAFQDSIRGDVSWYLINVKQDLEARKVIKVEWNHSRAQQISLRRKYKERLANYGE